MFDVSKHSRRIWMNSETKRCHQLWMFESAYLYFPCWKRLFASSRELNNIQTISPSKEENRNRNHSNSRKFEKLWVGRSSSSSACVESLDWNRYTLIGSKSDSSGGEMRYGKEREKHHHQQTPRPWNALRSKLPDLKRGLQTSCTVCIYCLYYSFYPYSVQSDQEAWGAAKVCIIWGFASKKKKKPIKLFHFNLELYRWVVILMRNKQNRSMSFQERQGGFWYWWWWW